MKTSSRPEGFTIVETLIVLAVTGFLFISVAVILSGRQQRTEFSEGSRDIETRIQKVISEVSSGYYPDNGSFECHKSGFLPSVNPIMGTQEQGTNKECIFLGKVIQFQVGSSDPEVFRVYSVVGLRESSPGVAVTALAQAHPVLININGAYDKVTMPYGLTTKSVVNVSTGAQIGAVAFISSLGNLDTAGPSQQVNVIPVAGTTLGTNTPQDITDIQTGLPLLASTPNPAKGVQVCVDSGSTKQYALYTIGGQGRQLTVSLDIKNGNCP